MKIKILLLFLVFYNLNCQENPKNVYVCPPCDLKCDTITFSEAGTCPHCNMELILRSELQAEQNLIVNDITINEGSGLFMVEGGTDKKKTILVHYHKPKNFDKNSKIIFVIPGAGRNGKEYRNAWKEASETYNVLVLCTEYSEAHYPRFWSYNLAGMIYDVDVQQETFKINQHPNEWLFNDFDRIFDAVKESLSFNATTYDMFGHSAGGQILHRLAIFKPSSKANRILASNSGWYTVPTTADIFPYGIRNIRESVQRLDFGKSLVLFLGEKDDASETRGHLRRSKEVDKQGFHRLERGIYFYNESKRIAAESDQDFNWLLEIVPDIGHDYKAMSQKAATYLYSNKE